MISLTLKYSILILAVALAIAGCGGSDSISKSEFIEQADAICKEADKTQLEEAGAYIRAHSKDFKGDELSETERQEKLILDIGLQSILKEVEELEALGAPDGEEEKVAAILSGIKAAVKAGKKDPEGVNHELVFLHVDRLAREYGLKDCSEPE